MDTYRTVRQLEEVTLSMGITILNFSSFFFENHEKVCPLTAMKVTKVCFVDTAYQDKKFC